MRIYFGFCLFFPVPTHLGDLGLRSNPLALCPSDWALPRQVVVSSPQMARSNQRRQPCDCFSAQWPDWLDACGPNVRSLSVRSLDARPGMCGLPSLHSLPLSVSRPKTHQPARAQIQHQLRPAKPVGTAIQISRCCVTEPTVRENRIVAHPVIPLSPLSAPTRYSGSRVSLCCLQYPPRRVSLGRCTCCTCTCTQQWPRPQPRFQGRWPAEEWDDETPAQHSGDKSHVVSSPHWPGAYYWQAGGAGPQAPITQSSPVRLCTF